jgi:hypothetical protein
MVLELGFKARWEDIGAITGVTESVSLKPTGGGMYDYTYASSVIQAVVICD